MNSIGTYWHFSALPKGIQAGEDLIRLMALTQDGDKHPDTRFFILKAAHQKPIPFSIRYEKSFQIRLPPFFTDQESVWFTWPVANTVWASYISWQTSNWHFKAHRLFTISFQARWRQWHSFYDQELAWAANLQHASSSNVTLSCWKDWVSNDVYNLYFCFGVSLRLLLNTI